MFRVFKGEDDQFYYSVKSRSGRVLSHSEGYTRRADAERGVHDLIHTIVQDLGLEITDDAIKAVVFLDEEEGDGTADRT